MDFWSQYYKESLGAPWLIQPKAQPGEAAVLSEAPVKDVVFITAPITQPALKTMMERMAVALKFNPEDVSFYESESSDLSMLEHWRGAKRVMVFGKSFSPQNFGLTARHGDHQIIVTHSLLELKKNPELKKETWEHLKEFARLS